MSIDRVIRWSLGVFFRLPRPTTRRVEVERNIRIAMRDGVELLADRHRGAGTTSGPVVLMRSPYGRGSLFGLMASLMAERGFQVIVQSVRGTCGSGGTLDPMRQEQADGIDTVEWIRAQPWFGGRLFTFGVSYLGNVQWALASKAWQQLDGMGLVLTLSNFRDELLSFGGYTQGGTLSWTGLMQPMVNYVPGRKKSFGRPKADAFDHVQGHLPLGTLDQVAFGKTIPWWQDWVDHDDPDDPWWQAIDHSHAAEKIEAPTVMIGGWRDIFLPFQVRDFEARQAAGREAWLTVGPWGHTSLVAMMEGLRQSIEVFSAVCESRRPHAGRTRVRLYLQGADEWRDYPSWPPPGGRDLRFHLRSRGRLDLSAPNTQETSACYVYNPLDPTPAVHGPVVIGGKRVREMSALESRRDVLLFTSEPFERDTDVIGPVKVELSIRSDRAHTDFYVCVCDVDEDGRSLQVLDGYQRLRSSAEPESEPDPTGVRHVVIECWPTAYRFKRGHRLRLIVASGAHPRYARNPGTGEPLAKAVEMVPAHQEVLLGSIYGSSIHLMAFQPTVR